MAVMQHPRPRGPKNVVRPYEPALEITNPTNEEQIVQALDHIAFSLAAIDHNLEMLAKNSGAMVQFLGMLAQK